MGLFYLLQVSGIEIQNGMVEPFLIDREHPDLIIIIWY